MNDAVFELNSQTLIGIGAILGTLAGAISFLFKIVVQGNKDLLAAKEAAIKDLNEQLAKSHEDRDYWRSLAMEEPVPLPAPPPIALPPPRPRRRTKPPEANSD